jgi:hypothetical protein
MHQEKPASWKQLIEIVANYDLSKLRREPSMLTKYKIFIDHIKEEFVSVEVYLAHKIFNAPLVKVVKDGKEKFDLDEVKKHVWKSNRRVILRPNDFPYFIEDGIYHDVLWSNETLDSDTIKILVHETMNELKRNDFIYSITKKLSNDTEIN